MDAPKYLKLSWTIRIDGNLCEFGGHLYEINNLPGMISTGVNPDKGDVWVQLSIEPDQDYERKNRESEGV